MVRESVDHPVANAPEAYNVAGKYGRGDLFKVWFGQAGTTIVYVWADSYESAFEEAVEWLDDMGYCGYFVTVTEEDLRMAAEEEGVDNVDAVVREIMSGRIESREANRVIQTAEADLTLVDHTSLRNCEKELEGGPLYVPSWEWGLDEVERGGPEWRRVLRRSVQEVRESE